MDYIELAGIKRGEETDLVEILARREQVIRAFMAAVESCETFGTSLPVNLLAKGNSMLEKPDNVRAFMTFLRACARLKGAAILCRKKGIVRAGKQTTQSLYKLLT